MNIYKIKRDENEIIGLDYYCRIHTCNLQVEMLILKLQNLRAHEFFITL